MPNESLIGKTALVTGAAQRIGRETALTLADAGVNVLVHYRNSEDNANELVDELKRRGVKAWTIKADFADPEASDRLIIRALETTGSLDILVNNASEFPASTLDSITFEDIQSNIMVNAWSPFVLCRSFARKVGKGKIVNMLDSRIRGYDWAHVAYILSKHMLAQLTKMCALQYAPDIQVKRGLARSDPPTSGQG